MVKIILANISTQVVLDYLAMLGLLHILEKKCLIHHMMDCCVLRNEGLRKFEGVCWKQSLVSIRVGSP